MIAVCKSCSLVPIVNLETVKPYIEPYGPDGKKDIDRATSYWMWLISNMYVFHFNHRTLVSA